MDEGDSTLLGLFDFASYSRVLFHWAKKEISYALLCMNQAENY